jgi:hypothetical protein
MPELYEFEAGFVYRELFMSNTFEAALGEYVRVYDQFREFTLFIGQI